MYSELTTHARTHAFPAQIEFPNPNEAARLDILKIHSRKMNLTRGIDLKKIADKLTGE